MSLIIGISGRKQSGKSTLAKYMESLFSQEVKIYSFADPLKRFLIDVLGLREEQCYGPDEDKNSFTQYCWDTLPDFIRTKYGDGSSAPIQKTGLLTSRFLMQIVGTEIMRNMLSDKIWINATFKLIKKEKPDIAIIADVRFKSEVDALLGCPLAYVVRLTRSVQEDNHPSETDLDYYDFSRFEDRSLVIDNNDITIEEKNKLVNPFVKYILGS